MYTFVQQRGGGGGSRRDPNHKSMYKCAYMYVHLSLSPPPRWNLLTVYVRNSVGVLTFKVNLEDFKRKCVMVETGNYWEVDNIVLNKIKGPDYNQNKQVQNEFLRNNASVAKRKGINIF